jgi:hypothetical protein
MTKQALTAEKRDRGKSTVNNAHSFKNPKSVKSFMPVNNLEINRQLASSTTIQQLEAIVNQHAENFNIVNCATALHRIAKV